MKKSSLLAPTILAISFFLMSHVAIAPTIPKLYALFQTGNQVSLEAVESLVTFPALFILIFVLISNVLVNWIGKKATVLIGLSLIGCSGLIPLIHPSFTMLYVSRVCLGMGIGLSNALSVTLLSDYFQGPKRSRLIGYRTACLNAGKSILTVLVGVILTQNVLATFSVYLLAFPLALVVFFILPNDSLANTNHKVVLDFSAQPLSCP